MELEISMDIEGQKTDSLSGFPRKDVLFSEFRKRFYHETSDLANEKWHMVFLNISGFKTFNDDCGYAEGNRLLRQFSELIRNTFVTENITRVYADQFAVLYQREDAKERVTQLHDEALNLRPDFRVWVSAGIYDLEDGDVSLDKALDYAKTACDMIKKGGQFCNIYSDDLKQKLDRQKYIVSHVDEAIENGWIVLYFQPVIRTLSGKICNGEALARWQDPEFGMISPGEFVPALEKSGQSYKLAKFVIDETAGLISLSGKMGMYPIPASINLSRRDFEEIDPFEEVEKAVKKYSISRNLLCIEITESTAMENPEKIKRYIERFHQAGYEVWMDDFGSAYSSLNALKDFDFDEIKLDMAFMRNFNEKSQKIVASCIDMAKDLGIHTLCEGVETKEQVQFLLDHGCEKIQGFYYSKPRPVSELKKMIDRGEFSYELSVERFLYDDAGQIRIDPDTAGAIVLCRDGVVFPLQISRQLREGARKAGIDSLKLRKPLEIEDTEFWQKLTTVLDNTIASGAGEETAYFLNGQYYILSAQIVTRSNAGNICTVTVRDITKGARGLVLENAGQVAQSVMDAYDCIYHLNLEKNEIEVVISGFSGEMAGKHFPYDPEEMSAFIYWRDRERFRAWADPAHIRKALKKGKKTCSDVFRIEHADGSRVWERFSVLKIAGKGDSGLVMCLRPSLYSDPGLSKHTENMLSAEIFAGEQTSSESESDGKNPDVSGWPADSLWNALMEQDALMLFWKNRDHRFVGASKSFLDYFGLSDFEEINGKNDEECRWHIDDRSYRDDEDEILNKGQITTCVPGRVIVNGIVRSVVTSKFPVYHDGEIVGLVGIFADADLLSTANGQMPNEAKIEQNTGVMTFSSWFNELREYEDNFNRMNEDYEIGVLCVSNYWKIYHEFGERTAEELAKVVADTIRSEVPDDCVIGRMDRENFVLVTKNHHFDFDLENSLNQVADVLALNHYVGAYSGMIASYFGTVGRDEANNALRTVGLALEKAEKSLSVRNFRNERSPRGVGATAGKEDHTILTRKEAQKEIDVLLHSIDFVRLSDPERKKIIRFDRDGTAREQNGNCFDIWGTGVPCENCISLRTLQTKERLTKFETDGENIFIVISRYVEVDGRPCAMEMVVRMNDRADMGKDERGIFIRVLSNSRARLYDDTLTGIHNRRYYNEILADHKVEAAAIIDVKDMKEINRTYGHLAGDNVIRHVAQTIATCVGFHDLARYSGEQFVIGFRKIDGKQFREKLKEISDKIRQIHLNRYPELHVTVAVDGTCRNGTFRELLNDLNTQ